MHGTTNHKHLIQVFTFGPRFDLVIHFINYKKHTNFISVQKDVQTDTMNL